jgi:hypothetical protein
MVDILIVAGYAAPFDAAEQFFNIVFQMNNFTRQT